MEREEAIDVIETLFPADSDNPLTKQTGERLLKQAKKEVQGWRTEPTNVLVRYASLCIKEENRPGKAL